MPGAVGEVEIKGLADLQRALRSCSREVRLGVRKKLRSVAEPVRLEAERLALEEISHIGPDWSQMRIGITTWTVYVAPKQRGIKQGAKKRRNLAPLLADEAMNPALENRRGEVVDLIGRALDDILVRNW